LRFGRPVIVVSGLPRSGTSMMMRMLQAGGVEIVSDGTRAPDAANPGGYFEYEPVKDLARIDDVQWIGRARGKAVKIVSSLLKYLPAENNYRVILMHRNLKEVLASQNRMLADRGEPVPDTSEGEFVAVHERHLRQVQMLLDRETCFESHIVRYADVLQRPADEARRLARFLRRRLDVERMATVADVNLYRNRR
jgi:hypothetical protein